MHHPIIICGVAGCGKSSLAAGLAARTGAPFIEGDDLHPPANIARMASGLPLTDDDRRPWLDRIGTILANWQVRGTPGIITCSALRLAYRNRLRAAAPTTRFILITVTPGLAAQRLASRPYHFMPASLLASQFAALEMPGPDEAVITLPATLALPQSIAAAYAALQAPSIDFRHI